MGPSSAVDRLRRQLGRELAASEEATAALRYLDKRRKHINFGWLRKNGCYVVTSHLEALARLLVA